MVTVWVLLAIIPVALLLGWPHVFGWRHGQSSTLDGLGREARRFIRGLGRTRRSPPTTTPAEARPSTASSSQR